MDACAYYYHCTKNEVSHLLKKSVMENLIFCAVYLSCILSKIDELELIMTRFEKSKLAFGETLELRVFFFLLTYAFSLANG